MNANLRRALFSAVIAVILIAFGASLAAAHHSTAPFDTTTSQTLSGTVKQVDWTNPHTWVWIDVPNDKNGVDTWGFEGMSPNYLGRRGWTKSTLKPGDKISVTFRPLRDGSKGGMFVSAARPTGEILRMTGEPTDKY